VLTVRGVSKRYDSVLALDNVSASFEAGEIHAVLGENGAGKSTLMHVLAGFSVPDSGSVEFDGVNVPFGRPIDCKRLGIGMIHQHFTLVPAFTVEENLALARLSGFGALDRSELAKAAMDQAASLGWKIEPAARTSQLPVGAQQRIEILKTLSGDVKIAIFDEPTAVLGPAEVEDLFRVLRELKRAGKVVILIAHKLAEVMAIADRVTVLRRGKVVAESAIEQVSPTILAEWMVGELPAPLQSEIKVPTSLGLAVHGVTAVGDRGEVALKEIDLYARRGEILGVGGVDGNGQVELAEVLAGVRPFEGRVEWEGREGGASRIAYIPQDRQNDGLAVSMSVEDNLLIEGHRRPALTRGPFINLRTVRAWSDSLIDRFDIKVASRKDPVSSLSGGNQQKVVVARALDERPDLLVAVNPSRGLDVKATEYVHRRILEARDQGAAVVLISTDHDELAALASRTVYLSGGQIVEGAGAEAVVGGPG
jgi:general nucleoside transport system ATP-binding protein